MAKEWEGGLGFKNPIEIQKYLWGLRFPVKKQDIIDRAKKGWANEMIVSALEKLPDKEFKKPTEISEEIGKMM